MDTRIITGFTVLWFAVSAWAQVSMVSSNLAISLPVENAALFTSAAWDGQNDHVAAYTGGVSNLIWWSNGAQVTNKFISGLNASRGLVLTTNRLYALSSTALYEYNWPAGSTVTNFALNDGFWLTYMATGGVYFVDVTNTGTRAIRLCYRHPVTGWTNLNQDFGAGLALSVASCQALDGRIYMSMVFDGNGMKTVRRFWETNGTVEMVDTNVLWIDNLELPKLYMTPDPARNRVYIECSGLVSGQFALGGETAMANYTITSLSNDFTLRTNVTFEWIQNALSAPGFLIPKTNSILQFTFWGSQNGGGARSVRSHSNIPLYAEFTITNSTTRVLGDLLPFAVTTDGWVVYRDLFRINHLRKFNLQ